MRDSVRPFVGTATVQRRLDRGRRACALGAAVGAVLSCLAAGTAGAFPPVGQAGPGLSEPRAALAAALACGAGVDSATRTPVLLVHGTGVTPEENWSVAYEPGLTSLGIPWCSVALPRRGTGDLQVSAEYLVYAIRELHRRAGRRIAVVGASQGGMLPRWALRFWPDTRQMVDDLVGLAASNHGTARGRLPCRRACFPAYWQQFGESRFIAALNSLQETFAGISYTNVYTRLDEVVTPPESSELHTGEGWIANVAVQDVCALQVADHYTLALADTTGFALVMDALSHAGPASLARVGARGCTQPPIPGFSPVGLVGFAGGLIARSAEDAPGVHEEPALRCYASGLCPPATGAPPARLHLTVRPRRVTAGRRARLRVRTRARIRGRLRGIAGMTVRVAGQRARSDRRGRVTVRVRFLRPGRRYVTAHSRRFRPMRTPITVSHRSRRARRAHTHE